MQFYGKNIALTSLLTFSSLLIADDTFPPIVVTAERIAQTVDQTLASVTVIDRQQIQQSQAQSVPELLQTVPGVTVTNNGGLGKASSLFLRGAASDQVLVLIDGIKAGSATVGTTAFEHIPIQQIERIEIVRGPRASLYGSEAIGGVIQIFTRKGQGKIQPNFSIRAGSDNTYQGEVGVAGAYDQASFSANITGLETDGFNSCRGEPDIGGCFTHEPDEDGYENFSGQGRIGYRFDAQTAVDVHWLRSEGSNQFDGDFQNQNDVVQQVLGAGLRFSPLTDWQISLKAGRSWDSLDNFKDGVFTNQYETFRDTVFLQNNFIIGDNHILTMGVDYQADEIETTTNYLVNTRENEGFFGQYLGYFNRHDLQLNLRYDDNAQFGSYTTGGVAWGYTFDQGIRLTANYGTAFKAPTFNELYFPDFGNPNLNPEESQTVEMRINSTTEWGNWAVNVYQTDIDELISFDAATYAPGNIDSARIRGLEAILGVNWQQWTMNTHLTLLDPINKKNDKLLPRRAEQTFHLELDRQIQRLRLGTALHAVGERYDDAANSRQLADYFTMDLRAAYQINKMWQIQARVSNIFDEDYEMAAFYPQAGRSWLITLRYQP